MVKGRKGIEGGKGLVRMKGRKEGSYKEVVGEVERVGGMYEVKWEVECIE